MHGRFSCRRDSVLAISNPRFLSHTLSAEQGSFWSVLRLSFASRQNQLIYGCHDDGSDFLCYSSAIAPNAQNVTRRQQRKSLLLLLFCLLCVSHPWTGCTESSRRPLHCVLRPDKTQQHRQQLHTLTATFSRNIMTTAIDLSILTGSYN